MSKFLTAVKPLYKQEVHHFDDLYPTSKAHESQLRIVQSEMKSQSSFVSAVESTSTLFSAIIQRLSNLLRAECMFMYEKIIFLWFFELNLPKWDIFEAMNKEYFVRLLTYLSIFLCNQSKLSTFAKLLLR